MKILLLGDIVGRKTVEFLGKNLWSIRRNNQIDMVIANGENATNIMGLSAEDAALLLDFGVDVLTGGNHIFHNRSLETMLDDSPFLVRPANVSHLAPGSGSTIFNCNGYRVLVINLVGMFGMEYSENPFFTVDRLLKREEGRYDTAIVDFHAEATAEKEAMGYYLNGRMACVFGTHTHVQTADEKILGGGTAYITDLGMCGPDGGILGTECSVILNRFLTGMPARFTPADGDIKLRGAILTVEGNRASAITRFVF